MRALSLDYRRTSHFWHWVGIVILTLAFGGAVKLGSYYLLLSKEMTHLENLIARIEHKLHSKRIAPPTNIAQMQRLGVEVKSANDVLLKMGLPWDMLFQSMESANNDNISLLGMDPDSKKGQIKISGEAKDFDALLGYIRTLQKNNFFTEVYLQHHQVQELDPDKPIRFTLDATWNDKHLRP
jgi:Tfp pilus assembly protein PilN